MGTNFLKGSLDKEVNIERQVLKQNTKGQCCFGKKLAAKNATGCKFFLSSKKNNLFLQRNIINIVLLNIKNNFSN